VTFLSVILFFIISSSVLLVAILLNPEHLNNSYFWITVGWLILLILLNWFASTFIFFGVNKSNSNQRYFGILPSFNILVFVYSLISASLIISTWYINGFGVYSNSHLILQIILFAITASITILMFIASKAAQINTPDLTLTKDELILILKRMQSHKNLDEDENILIKELSEIIKYSMPHLSKLNSVENYQKLTMIFTDKKLNNNKNLNIQEIENAIFLAKNC